MRDQWNREIDYLRISITDRCNLRCRYCMPEEGVTWFEHSQILTYEEIIRLCRIFYELGIRKVKVTGGEPLVRKGVADPGIERVVSHGAGDIDHQWGAVKGTDRWTGGGWTGRCEHQP